VFEQIKSKQAQIHEQQSTQQLRRWITAEKTTSSRGYPQGPVETQTVWWSDNELLLVKRTCHVFSTNQLRRVTFSGIDVSSSNSNGIYDLLQKENEGNINTKTDHDCFKLLK
jgi:hypothetical protein